MFKFRLYILLVISLFSVKKVVAQNSYNLLNLYTDTVRVTSSYKAAPTQTVGARQSIIPINIITQSSVKSLADLLTENSMIYIKSYGDGALATSSFRGTNSTHTAVNWNGIKINPAMSGGFDFSQFPVFFIDGVTMSHGGSDFSGGSGAIGGNVALTNSLTENDSTLLSGFAEVGSFSTYAAGVALKYGGEKSKYKTRLYYKNSQNDFRYLNKVYGKDDFYEHREESAYSIAGAMQEGYFKLKNNSDISSALMVTYGDRELPQPIVVNVTRNESQKTFSTKFSTKYKREFGNNSISVTGGYIFDFFNYEQSFGADKTDLTKAKNNAHTILLKGDYNHRFSEQFSINSALIYNHDIVMADSYTSSTINRDVASLMVNGEWKPTEKLSIDASLMGEINNRKAAPTATAGGPDRTTAPDW
ncbi:MAG: TonB-dependent receptor plug domain-containing protein, partial [Rikenellaceae bacterium]